MYPQFEEETKIEHLQGYLYSQQAISNTVLFNPGSMYEYAVTELDNKQLTGDLRSDIALYVLNRLKGNMPITATEIAFFQEESHLELLSDWEITLAKKLEKWFIDPYLYLKLPKNHYEKMVQEEWTEAQKERFLKNAYEGLEASNKRLTEHRPASSSFIHIIQLLLGKKDLEVWQFSITNTFDKRYPRYMDLYWGMQFDLFVIKKGTKHLLLHLGNVLT
jgi:hypothetical protein